MDKSDNNTTKPRIGIIGFGLYLMFGAIVAACIVTCIMPIIEMIKP